MHLPTCSAIGITAAAMTRPEWDVLSIDHDDWLSVTLLNDNTILSINSSVYETSRSQIHLRSIGGKFENLYNN